ncbi:MAG: MFS transporter [Candidatus Woesearchaeota archaeon]
MRFFDKGELKLLWPFYLDALLSPILFFMPAFMVVYFFGIGLSATQMSILLAIWPATSLIFEIPTGAFADIYGRKASVLTGYFLEGLAVLSLFFWDNYYLMLASFAFLGFAATFSSGSKEAWIADLIKKKNSNLMHNYFSKSMAFDSFALILSGFLGAFLVRQFGISIMWIVAFFSFLVSICILLFAKEYFTARKIKLRESFNELKTQTIISLKYSYKHHVLFYFMIAGFIAAFSLSFQTTISWTPLLKEFGMKDYQFGYLWSVMSAVLMLAPLFAMKFLKKGKEKNFIIFGMAVSTLITALVVFAFNLPSVIGIMLIAMFFYFSKSPAQRVYFHRFIPSKLRATVGSVESMLLAVASIIALPFAGILIDKIGARYTIFFSAVIMIPAIIFYLKIKENKSQSCK